MFIRYHSLYFAVERQHRKLKEMLQGKLDTEASICSNLAYGGYYCKADTNYSAYDDYLTTRAVRLNTFRMWSRFSGDPSFPVPACVWASAYDEYLMADNSYALWDKSTAYGAMRYELLNYMEHRYSLFLMQCICPQWMATVNIYHDDGYGNLKLIDLDQDNHAISIFLRCDHN